MDAALLNGFAMQMPSKSAISFYLSSCILKVCCIMLGVCFSIFLTGESMPSSIPIWASVIRMGSSSFSSKLSSLPIIITIFCNTCRHSSLSWSKSHSISPWFVKDNCRLNYKKAIECFNLQRHMYRWSSFCTKLWSISWISLSNSLFLSESPIRRSIWYSWTSCCHRLIK